jgi:short-subunit dehydrogenase
MPRGSAQIALASGRALGESDNPALKAAVLPRTPVRLKVPAAWDNSGVGMSFANQVAVITGASSGIGWAVAKALAREGCKVGLVARRKEKLEDLSKEIQALGGYCAWAQADVGNRTQTVEAIHRVGDGPGGLGPIDLLIANAGVGMPTLLDPPNVPQIEQMIRVNLLGVVYAVEAALPGMLRRGRGHLAAVSSLAAYKGLPGESAYCASKAAVNTYMEGLRIQLREKGIAVTTICPGFVRTPMTEVNDFHMPWLLEADDAAQRIVRALHRRRKVYNFPWQTTLLMKVTRWLPDWIMARSMRKYNEKPPFPPVEAR